MRNYLLPSFGGMSVKQIKPKHLIEVFRKIEEKGTLYSSKRACQLCSNVMQYAVALEIIEINPVPSIRQLLKVPKYGHFSAVTDPQSLGRILKKIEAYEGYSSMRNALRTKAWLRKWACRSGALKRILLSSSLPVEFVESAVVRAVIGKS